MNYEELLKEADELGLITKEIPLYASDGRIKGNLFLNPLKMTLS